MGTPLFAVPILKSLYQNGYQVSAVYTQPPQKSQRGQKINKSPIQGICETLKIECRTPSSLKNNKEEYNYLKELDADIERPNTCEVEYLDYDGKKKLLKAEGLLATCIQHEMDHLEGILFIDYLSKLKKSMIIKKLSKIKINREIL